MEDALLQMKSIEEAISENAKGILASTMKQEISELVRESLNGSTKKSLYEQVEDDEEVLDDQDSPEGDDVDTTEDGTEETDVEAEVDGDEFDFSAMTTADTDNEDEMPPLDMTGAKPHEVLKVFKAMGDDDGIIIKKDGDDIHLTDTNTNHEYLINLGGDSENIEAMPTETNEGVIYELVFEEDETNNTETHEEYMDEEYMDEEYMDEEYMDEEYMDEEEEVVYELEVQETMKPKGVGFGKVKTGMSKSSVNNKGFDEDMADGTKSEKKGKGPKFSFGKIKHGVTESEMDEEYMDEDDYNEGWMDEDFDMMDNEKMEGDYMEGDYMEGDYMEGDYMEDDVTTDEIPGETAEASRTLGNGKYWGRNGLPKPKAAPRHLKVESRQNELNLLKEKNEEYKKALDFFRNKLNEVAVFNSNLAYSTRLFTEHSTTKQEKINILRRFDNVESIKESKSLYKTIKNELDGSKGSNEVVTESVQRQVSRTPSNGSASNLIESKTYENPQFMRMRDLMLKIK